MPLFQRYVMVDWSAASRPTRGKDSIWIGAARPGQTTTVENIATRFEARARLHRLAADALGAGERLLIGVDFPFGYPAGVARHVTGQPNALTLWRWIAARLRDAPDNANNRFEVAGAINRLYPGTGPFWGRPAAWDHPDIPVTEKARSRAGHPPERRLADLTAKGAKTVWQLAYAGAVGSQVLTGLPALLALRDDPELAPHMAIWPFETGLAAPRRPITLAEIYPSLLPPDPGEAVKDAGQVRAVADWLAGLDRDDALAPLFAGPAGASAAERRAIVTEEAWILGLGAPPVRAVGAPSAVRRPAAMPMAVPGAPGGADQAAPADAKADGAKPDTGRPDSAARRRARALPDPAELANRAEAIARDEARLDHLPGDLQAVAIRIVQASGMPEITARLAWSDGIVQAARQALASGAPVLCDGAGTAALIDAPELAGRIRLLAPLSGQAPARPGTDAADQAPAALGGALVAIGQDARALAHLLDGLDRGWPPPAAILAFPAGLAGAAEAKAGLARHPRAVPYLTLRGRRGGPAMASAAVAALAGTP